MKVNDEANKLIHKEFDTFKTKMYKGLSPEDRKRYGMVYTPADISIRMIEKFKVESLAEQRILDPCCGSGNLLVACLLAGADADKLYGNELNRKMVRLARRRIKDICADTVNYPNIRNRDKFRPEHIHVGDATKEICLTYFCSDYPQKLSDELRGDLGFGARKPDQHLLDRVNSDADFQFALPDEGLTKSDIDEAAAVAESEVVSQDTEINNSGEQHEAELKAVNAESIDRRKALKKDKIEDEQVSLW